MALEIRDRPSMERWLMHMAWLCSVRATCHRGRAGCVITSSDGIVLSTGYNGTDRRGPHCIDTRCAGACAAVHAEDNAVRNLSSDAREIADMIFVTCSPCASCASIIASLPRVRIVHYDHKHHRVEKADAGLSILMDAGIIVREVCTGDPFTEHGLTAT